jgi:hypothetical protein
MKNLLRIDKRIGRVVKFGQQRTQNLNTILTYAMSPFSNEVVNERNWSMGGNSGMGRPMSSPHIDTSHFNV